MNLLNSFIVAVVLCFQKNHFDVKTFHFITILYQCYITESTEFFYCCFEQKFGLYSLDVHFVLQSLFLVIFKFYHCYKTKNNLFIEIPFSKVNSVV